MSDALFSPLGGREQLEEAELLAPALVHEMRQPMTGIRAGLELLSRRLGTQVTGTEEWALIVSQMDRLEELLRAYQDFLHPERAAPAPFPVRHVVERAVGLLHHRIRKLGPRFVFEPGEGLPPGLGIATALLHVTPNVLGNALDALEQLSPGTGMSEEARLHVRILRGRALQVRISDSGPGVPSALQEKIFELRFTTKPTGSGLGLAIARKMMASFGGAVRLVPQDDPLRLAWAKTEFCIEVPCEPERQAG